MEHGGWQHQQPDGASNVPRLRPLDIGQKIDAAIKLTTRNFGTLATIVLLVAAPVQILTVLVTVSTLPDDYTVGDSFGGGTATPDSTTDVAAGYWVGQGVVALLALLVYLLTTAGCFKAIGSAYLGDRTTWQDSLGFALKRLPSVLWVSILVFLVTVLGFLLLIVPGVYVAVAFSLALPVLLLEQKKGGSALGRSRKLIEGRWWRTFGVLLAGYVLASVVAGIVQGILAALMFVAVGDDSVMSVILSGLAGLAGQVITTPFVAALVTVLYFDLRVRKEAFDLQVLAQAMGGRAPTDAMSDQSMPWFAPQQPAWGGGQPWGAPGQQQPGAWGQPQQPPAWGQPGQQQPPAWGQPQQQPGGWGQPQQPPAWGQPQQQPPAGWGQPQQPPAWGQPPAGPPSEGQQWGPPQPGSAPPGDQPAPTQQQPQPAWGAPGETREQPQPGQGGTGAAPPGQEPPSAPQRWEPPAPPEQPPAPPQQWEPPRPPDPPDRSSS